MYEYAILGGGGMQMKKHVYKIGLVLLILLTLFILPIWSVQTIDIVGNVQYETQTLLDTIGFKEGRHILSYNKKKIVQQIEELLYVEQAAVAYTFPNHIQLSIQERRPIAYTRFLDTYLCIDEWGYVIEQNTERRLQLPTIEGLKFESFVLGEALQVENSQQMGIVRELVKSLNKYSFTEYVDTIDVSNIQQIHLYVDKLNVIIGTIKDFDEKVQYLIEVHKHYVMGILDLSMIEDGQAVLKPVN